MLNEGMGARKGLGGITAPEFVEVLFASSLHEAADCCSLLEDANIPARLEDSLQDHDEERGVAVLVPADRLVEASEFLASHIHHEVAEEDHEEDVGDDDADDADDDYDDDEDDDDVDDADDDDEDDDDETDDL